LQSSPFRGAMGQRRACTPGSGSAVVGFLFALESGREHQISGKERCVSGVQKPATISDLVKATGKSRPTVYRLLADGELPGYRTSRGYIIPREWFDRWQRGEWAMPEKPSEPADEKQPIDFLRQIDTERTA